MKTPRAARVWLLAAAAALGAGCASGPDSGSTPIVTRTSKNTTWATPEALAADAAAADAAAARRNERTPPRPAPAPADARPAAGAAPGGAVPAATASAAPADAALPADARRIYFDFDRSEIRPEFLPLIERHARRLSNDHDLRLALEGHADERGGAEYNLALGQRRAESVLRALVAAGAQEGQLEALSFGDTRPVATGHDEVSWAQNRRVEIKDR
ncbi:MAG: OmpA family protein [Rubrivivax sp.]